MYTYLKTAGQSVERFLIDQVGLDVDTERERLGLGRNPVRDRGTEKLAHLSAREYVDCGLLSEERFRRYFKFAFVRNPYERIVSEYRYRNRLFIRRESRNGA